MKLCVDSTAPIQFQSWPYNLMYLIFEENVAKARGAYVQNIDAALGTLDDRRRMAVILYYMDREPKSAIAEELGIAPTRVAALLYSSLVQLRRYPARGYLESAPEGNVVQLEMELCKTYHAYRLAEQMLHDRGIDLGDMGVDGLGHDAILQRGIDVLQLSPMAYNALRRGGVDTIMDLITHSERELMRIRCLGENSVRDICKRLGALGLSLRKNG